jgi:tRNA pseudouridine55 synthase
MIGLLNIHKPAGDTSRDVVNLVQRLVRPDKAGHAGTLDPLATGVLVVCIGGATRLVPFIQEQHKVYRATFLLGRTSDTDDVEGHVTVLERAPAVTREQVLATLPRFVGRIEQTPPQFSAVKVQGERAYNLARAGRKAEIQPRLVDIYRLELLAFEPPELLIEIECGSGTYVRSIGRDLGALLGSGAVMSALVRTRIGPFRIEDSVPLDALTRESLAVQLLPAAWAVADKPRCDVDAARLADLRRGRSVLMPDAPSVEGEGPLAVFGPDGQLAARAALRNGRLFPTLVLGPSS